MLLIEIFDKKKLNFSEEIFVLDNQHKFEIDSQFFRTLKNDLNIITGNNIF